MFHYHSLGSFCVISGILLPLTEVNLHYFRSTTANHRGSSVSFNVSQATQLGGLASLLVPSAAHGVSSHCPRCPKVAQKHVCVIIAGVLLPLTEMFLCHVWCPTLAS